ncbi:TetR family transcriptional regulator [Novosphingobium sp. ST904]|nr:TetR family transcriptional regulator [Novosphingobium sp. ST904]
MRTGDMAMNDAGSLLRAKTGRDALLAAAASIFFEQGYEATRIDDIIERAGGSKRNIYEEFGSKEGLFAAIVTERAERALSALAMDEIRARSLEETLRLFGRQLMDSYMSKALLGVFRIAIIEHVRFPFLIRRFYDLGPGLASARLAELLLEAQRRGDLREGDCAMAADHFVAMIRGNVHLQVVLRLRAPPLANERRALVDSAVALLLQGWGKVPEP